MRRWQNLAAPDDAGSWYAVDGFWPTSRGTYESIEFLTATTLTATGAGAVSYAFVAKTVSGAREYVVDSAVIWEYSGGALTDRTGGVTIGTAPMMVNYGDITICVMGNATATVKSSGGNFSALAGAPKGEIVVVQSNAVVVFNTDTSADGWAASDVGDYTNWTTGEAASGRLLATPGPVTAAIPWGNDIIVFKANSIYRMTYVGGLVKWATQLICIGFGVAAGLSPTQGKYCVMAGNRGILFVGTAISSTYGLSIYLFDGASRPSKVNSLTSFNSGRLASYDPYTDIYCMHGCNAVGTQFYNATVDAWGYTSGGGAYVGANSAAPLMGDFAARAETSPMPVVYAKVTAVANQLKRYAPTGTRGVGTQYVQTAMLGFVDAKSLANQAIPILRRRTDVGTQTASLQVDFFRELHDTSASSTQASIAESTLRARFDFQGVDNFARFKFSVTDYDVEIDDLKIAGKSAGKN